MIKLYDKGVYLLNGEHIVDIDEVDKTKNIYGLSINHNEAVKGTISYSILAEHNKSKDMRNLRITFDSMASHDITFVGIVQTAKASGLDHFPIPYVLTNCHNSLCAVGGTINEDDHIFGLSAAQKYGGIYVPPHIAVIHQYMRECYAGCGKMIIGSDSHTRYGALGTMAIGEGGGELVKQLLGQTYDVEYPEIIGIYLKGKPNYGVGPQDVALAIIGEVYDRDYVKNKVVEFVGPGISSMTTDYRNSLDVMTTETACLSSIWRTDEETEKFLSIHGRIDDYKELNPADVTYYDGMIEVDLSSIKPMIALPFHPSNTYEIDELNANLEDILHKVEVEAGRLFNSSSNKFSLTDKIVDGKLMIQQGEIAGCAGGNYINVIEAAHILKGKSCGNDIFNLNVYPSSQAVYMDLLKKGAITDLMASGATIRTAFCGPCFGAGDTPAHNSLSIRHTTRNFPNREGSKPGKGQFSAVALMDARSIAATAANGGVLTSATEIMDVYEVPEYEYDHSPYKSRVFNGYKKQDSKIELIEGPNIKPWPEMKSLSDNILLKVCSKIMDDVTTTDELIPSGETSSYRSNPLDLANFTLSRRDPKYVQRSKDVKLMEDLRGEGKIHKTLESVFETIRGIEGQQNILSGETEIGSVIYCIKPGDGSAREQAASCQRILGGLANICEEYATKRYRSNLINWGMIPFQMVDAPKFEVGDFIYVPNIRKKLESGMDSIRAYVIKGTKTHNIELYISSLTDEEKEIIKSGSLINYNKKAK